MDQEFARIFLNTHPNFFEEEVKNLEPEQRFEEMLLELADYEPEAYTLPLPENVAFGMYAGNRDKLLAAVAEVEDGWPEFFGEKARVYCAMVEDEIASFCLLEEFGCHMYKGRRQKFGGPGCVGTVPKYRRQGIGLALVAQVTQMLRDEGCDLSYIHYTAVARWYAKLGYHTVLRWNRDGILDE